MIEILSGPIIDTAQGSTEQQQHNNFNWFFFGV